MSEIQSSQKVLALTSNDGSHCIFGYELRFSKPMGWLSIYNPDAYDGQGYAKFSHEHALRFMSPGDALRCCHLVPDGRRQRADGRPNKPLTAFTLEVLPYGCKPTFAKLVTDA